MTQEAMTTETEAANTSEGAATSNQADTTATAAEMEGQQQQATEAVKTEEGKPQGAPEAYEFSAPEGQEFDPAVIEQFSEVAKDLNLTQDAAQKVLDKMAPAIAQRQVNALAEAHKGWIDSTKADGEIGGDKLAENIAVANTAFEKFGTPELRALLDETGLGDHPEMIRWAHRVGKAMSEDGFVSGRGNNTAPTDPAKRMFPNMN